MRTSLNEIKEIDDHLFQSAPSADAFLFEAKMMLDKSMCDKVRQQQEAHLMIQQYGRKKLVAEIAAVHRQLFRDTRPHSFAGKILHLFK
jgi:hypothetical protein